MGASLDSLSQVKTLSVHSRTRPRQTTGAQASSTEQDGSAHMTRCTQSRRASKTGVARTLVRSRTPPAIHSGKPPQLSHLLGPALVLVAAPAAAPPSAPPPSVPTSASAPTCTQASGIARHWGQARPGQAMLGRGLCQTLRQASLEAAGRHRHVQAGTAAHICLDLSPLQIDSDTHAHSTVHIKALTACTQGVQRAHTARTHGRQAGTACSSGGRACNSSAAAASTLAHLQQARPLLLDPPQGRLSAHLGPQAGTWRAPWQKPPTCVYVSVCVCVCRHKDMCAPR